MQPRRFTDDIRRFIELHWCVDCQLSRCPGFKYLKCCEYCHMYVCMVHAKVHEDYHALAGDDYRPVT